MPDTETENENSENNSQNDDSQNANSQSSIDIDNDAPITNFILEQRVFYTFSHLKRPFLYS